MPAYTSKKDEEFFGAIGRLTISWAQIELGLDCAIDIIHRYLEGHKVKPNAPKLSLSRKTEYIRKWIKSSPEQTFRKAVHKLLGEIDKAAITRHDLIHGAIIKYEEGSGEAEIVRLIHTATNTEKKYLTVTTVQILRAAVSAGELGHRSLILGTELQNLIVTLAEANIEENS
jgi:hypothetical protein